MFEQQETKAGGNHEGRSERAVLQMEGGHGLDHSQKLPVEGISEPCLSPTRNIGGPRAQINKP
jgi:hypothetical protein